jgi:hypothetical protein
MANERAVVAAITPTPCNLKLARPTFPSSKYAPMALARKIIEGNAAGGLADFVSRTNQTIAGRMALIVSGPFRFLPPWHRQTAYPIHLTPTRQPPVAKGSVAALPVQRNVRNVLTR